MANKAINLDIPFLGLGGEEGKDTIGKILGGILAQSASTDKNRILKFGDWALKLWKGETLELDKADEDTLREAVISSEGATIWLKHQILAAMDGEGPHPGDNPIHPKKKK